MVGGSFDIPCSVQNLDVLMYKREIQKLPPFFQEKFSKVSKILVPRLPVQGHIDFDLRDNIRAEQKKLGMLPDGHPTYVFLDKLGVKTH